MAYKYYQITAPRDGVKKYATKEFICDTPDDIQNLPKYGIEGTQFLNDGDDIYHNEPVDYGSTAIVAEPYSGHVLKPSNDWHQIF